MNDVYWEIVHDSRNKGGVIITVYYFDEKGNRIEKEKATRTIRRVEDGNGKLVAEEYCLRKIKK